LGEGGGQTICWLRGETDLLWIGAIDRRRHYFAKAQFPTLLRVASWALPPYLPRVLW